MIKVLLGETSKLMNKKIEEYTSSSIDERDDFNYCVFDFEINPLDEILDCLSSPSFSSPKKVVICKNPFFFSSKKVKTQFTNDYKKLEAYVENENEDSTFLIILPPRYVDKRNKYYNYFLKKGYIENLTLEKVEDLRKYALKLIDEYNLHITNDAFELFISRMTGVALLETEIEKLTLCDKEILIDDVKALTSIPFEDDIFELSKALLEKNHSRIMKIYNDLKLQKVQPVQMIVTLASQFRLILQAGILDNKGMSQAEIASYLNIHPYRIKIALETLYKYNIWDIEDSLIELANLDREIKNGTKDRFIDFEIFLATK